MATALEDRVAMVEAEIKRINDRIGSVIRLGQSDVADLKADIAGLRAEMAANHATMVNNHATVVKEMGAVRSELDTVRASLDALPRVIAKLIADRS